MYQLSMVRVRVCVRGLACSRIFVFACWSCSHLSTQEAKKYISPKALEAYQAVIRNLKGVMQTVQALDANPSFNDPKRRITMDINLKIGQLCPDNQVVRARVCVRVFVLVFITDYLFVYLDGGFGASVPRSSGARRCCVLV